MAALDACNRYRLTSPLRPRRRHRHTRRTTAAPFSSLFSRSIRASLSFALSLPLSFHILLMPSFASRSNFPKISSPPPIRLPPSSHSSQPPRFPIPSPSSLALLFLLERPRESLSSFRTLLPTVPLPHSHRPRRYRFLSSSSALLLSHPSQASRVCRPRRRARCTSSSSSVEPSFRVCQLVFPLARRGPRGGGGGRKERRRPGDVMERVTRETREENGGKGRRTKGASSSNRKLPKYFTS